MVLIGRAEVELAAGQLVTHGPQEVMVDKVEKLEVRVAVLVVVLLEAAETAVAAAAMITTEENCMAKKRETKSWRTVCGRKKKDTKTHKISGVYILRN